MLGQVYELSTPEPDESSNNVDAAAEQTVLSALENALYRDLYIRPTRPHAVRPVDELAKHARVAALAAANSGRGTWSVGWVVHRSIPTAGSSS